MSARPAPIVAPHHLRVVQVVIDDAPHEITVEIHGEDCARVAPTRNDPGQPGGFVVEAVKYEGTYITHLFSERQLEMLADEE